MARSNGFARVISVLAALTVLVVTVAYPRIIAEDGAHVPHPLLELMLLGMSLCWVHGFGFIPQNRVLRIIFSPFVAWPVIAIGIVLTLTAH